ncbi:putative dnaJ subfamily C member 1 [Cricetulus griseus]|nr:putative dnaJ subfamily C member 1 [Cricetulus griseus]
MWAPGFGPARIPQRRRPGPLSSSVWLLLLFLLAAVGPVRAWESGDLELFDLVEEVQLNFYEFLGVQQLVVSYGSFLNRSFIYSRK